jgi:hypothetical protein
MSHAAALRLNAGESAWKRLIGLPFLPGGAGAWWAVAQVDEPPALLLGVFGFLGLVFSLVGAVFLFVRVETRIERDTGTITDVIKILVPIWRKSRPLGDVARVVIGIEAHTNTSADDFEYQVYSVWLKGRARESEGIRLATESDYAAARAHGQAAARYLGVPLEDDTSDAPDDRVARPLPAPAPPPGRRITRDASPGGSGVNVAPVRFQSIHFLYLAVALAFPSGVHFLLAPEVLSDITHPRARLFFRAFLYGASAGSRF